MLCGVRFYLNIQIKITRVMVEFAPVSFARDFHASVVLYSGRNIYLEILFDFTTALTVARIARERTETPSAIERWAFSCFAKYF